ncbi:MAG: 3-deoxy-7-phosphoheptulonate synthase [Draconibacterium sp.]
MKVVRLNHDISGKEREIIARALNNDPTVRFTGNDIVMPDHSGTSFLKKAWIEEIVEQLPDYVLASRDWQASDTEILVGNDRIGDGNLTIIAGPCAVESWEQINRIAGDISEMGMKFLRGGAYKPRTSPYSFRGLKAKGLGHLQKVKDKYGLKIVTELMCTESIDELVDVADVLQIGSRNMYNYSLLECLGGVNKPILLKRGMSAKLNEFLLAAEYIISHGNKNVILCERGISTFETATRNTLDLNAVPYLKQHAHLPVIVDPSHGTGIRPLVAPMALAAVACGADGLEIEVHHKPDEALCDGKQSLQLSQFKKLIKQLETLKKSGLKFADYEY